MKSKVSRQSLRSCVHLNQPIVPRQSLHGATRHGVILKNEAWCRPAASLQIALVNVEVYVEVYSGKTRHAGLRRVLHASGWWTGPSSQWPLLHAQRHFQSFDRKERCRSSTWMQTSIRCYGFIRCYDVYSTYIMWRRIAEDGFCNMGICYLNSECKFLILRWVFDFFHFQSFKTTSSPPCLNKKLTRRNL